MEKLNFSLKIWTLLFACVCAVVVLLTWCSPFVSAEGVQPTPAEGVVGTLIDGVKLREGLVTSARGEYEHVLTSNKDPKVVEHVPPEVEKKRLARYAFRVKWAFAPDVFREETIILDSTKEGEPEISRSTIIQGYDGERGWYYEPATGYAMEASTREDCEAKGIVGDFGDWLGLGFIYGRGKPLSQVLLDSRATFVGTESLNGMECYKLTAPANETGAVYSWWIAPSLGYNLVKRTYQPSQGAKRRAVFEYSYSLHDDVWFPERRIHTAFMTLDGVEYWVRKTEITSIAVQIKPGLTREFFRPNYAVGTEVYTPDGVRKIE